MSTGADVRLIQALLGHVRLETTRFYTEVAITYLREAYKCTHLAANVATSETFD